MDQERFMIIIKGDDKTKDVFSYESDPPIARIVYKGSSKVYTYQLSDIQLPKPTIEEITEDMAVGLLVIIIYMRLSLVTADLRSRDRVKYINCRLAGESE